LGLALDCWLLCVRHINTTSPHGREAGIVEKIIVVNDDGPRSPGLKALIEGLRTVGPVLAVVPEEGVGGRGKSITLFKPVKARKLEEGLYLVSGTPADAFLISLELLKPDKPAILASGINMGPNIGLDDIFHSGTLGAAIQAALYGVPAIAISYAIGEGLPRPSRKQMEADLKLAAEVAARLARSIMEGGMPENVDIISVNVPVEADLGKLVITEPLRRPFWAASGDGTTFSIRPWPGGRPSGPVGSDIWAILEGYISISPISIKFGHATAPLRGLLKRAGLM